jgi:hypothetical protein
MHTQDSSDPTGITSDYEKGHEGKEVIRARNRKANAALQMKLAKAGWDEIAEVLGYPTARAARVAVERALELDMRQEDNRQYLRTMVDRQLDRLLRAVWAKAIDPEHPEQLAAWDKARAAIADHRKLYGLDAPTEVTVHQATAAEIEAWIQRVSPTHQVELEEADIFEEGDIVDADVVNE